MPDIKKFLTGSITLPFEADSGEALAAARRIARRAGLPHADGEYAIYRRSVDARRRDEIKFVYTVLISFSEPVCCRSDALEKAGLRALMGDEIEINYGSAVAGGRPVVVGSGPAGMFCALMLAENGYRPLLIERGAPLEERVRTVGDFFSGGALDTETNVMFGAGGAGTFSDGKLVTRVNDPYTLYVLRRLVELGAPKEILWQAKPHVGTDLLRGVVSRLLSRIAECGGEVTYHCRLDSVTQRGDEVLLSTSQGEIKCGAVVLAVGHSARDTYTSLLRGGFALEPKPFSVGARIEHKADDIDAALYGRFAGDSRLGRAEYALSDTKSDRGVYTFCMCPGGEVIAAASEEGGVVVNGMSNHARRGENSNSAVLASVFPADYGASVEGAIEYQRRIERAAFAAAGGNFAAPVETVGDFLAGASAHLSSPSRILPSYTRGGTAVCDLRRILPEPVSEEIARGIKIFGKRISGFDAPDALLTGVETRTSSPVRILRDGARTACGADLVYPCGEGAGYAGGITSAALDGIKTALAIMSRFAPDKK